MVTKWGWKLLKLSRKLWVRTVAFALLALLSALVAVLLQDVIPASAAGIIGAGAAEKILTILASSMLAVTTFSLSIMIAAFSASTNSVSPRATRLLMEDSTTHNALATFVGSFLYSIVSIILLNTKLYNERGEVVLFITTIVVTALMAFVKDPWLGANPLTSLSEVPASARAFLTDTIGYIQHVDVSAISKWAEANACRVFIVVRAGVFIDPRRPLLWIDGELPENTDSLSKAFTIEDFRSFDQDPRFGLLVLAEIASKALSPAVNDPGTAIEIIGRGMRVLSNWQLPDKGEVEVCYNKVWQLGLALSDLFDDFFTPIARDGAALVEIHIRLQKSFIALAKLNPQLRIQARRHSEAALARVEKAQSDATDLAHLKALHRTLMDA